MSIFEAETEYLYQKKIAELLEENKKLEEQVDSLQKAMFKISANHLASNNSHPPHEDDESW